MTLQGLTVPVPTLFGPDGEVDIGRNGRYTRQLCDAHVDHLWVLGPLGEAESLTDRERTKVLEGVLESLTWRTDAWVGVQAPTAERAAALGDAAEEMGASALLVGPPPGSAGADAEIERFYRSVRETTRIPLVAWESADPSAPRLSSATLRALATSGVLNGVVHAGSDLSDLPPLIAAAPSQFTVIIAPDPQVAPGVRMGATGSVMSTANLVPRLALALWVAVRSPDADSAELQRLVDQLSALGGERPLPETAKFLAAALRGSEVGYRAPHLAPDPEVERRLRLELGELEPRLRPFLSA